MTVIKLIKKYSEEEKEIRDCDEPGEIIQIDEDNEEIEEEVEEKKILVNEFFLDENSDIKDPKYQKVKENIEQFFVPKNQVINHIKKQIEKDSFIKLLEGNEKEELFELFFKDYFSQIITLLIQKEDYFYYDLLMYLISLRICQYF